MKYRENLYRVYIYENEFIVAIHLLFQKHNSWSLGVYVVFDVMWVLAVAKTLRMTSVRILAILKPLLNLIFSFRFIVPKVYDKLSMPS